LTKTKAAEILWLWGVRARRPGGCSECLDDILSQAAGEPGVVRFNVHLGYLAIIYQKRKTLASKFKHFLANT
jgi:hypothetical protein